jgi:hypothetical protein
LTIHPQYIKDANGDKSLVILPVIEFEKMMEELEKMEDLKLYDQAKKEKDEERILLDDYIHQRESNHV